MKGGVAAFTRAALHLAHDLAKTGNALGNVGAVMVAEPSSHYPWVGHKGALWLKGETSGVTAHGSMPDKGENAIYNAARAISNLEELDFNVAHHSKSESRPLVRAACQLSSS